MTTRRFIPSRLDGVEDVELYQPGGFCPISIGQTFAHGRYKVVHKLGFGGSSTVWLARDLKQERNRLVTLKALCADTSASLKLSPGTIPEIAIPEKLSISLPSGPSIGIQTIDDHFFEQNPNGSHLFLVSTFAGPSVLAMSDSPGRVAGSRRLCADLARKVATQTATTMYHIHRAGVVHGDLTTSNILFRLAPNIHEWSDAELYTYLGEPETEEIYTLDNKRYLGLDTPTELVAPIENAKITSASFLQESTILNDFGQAYAFASQPENYRPGTIVNYQPPETRFEERHGFEADIWALGCAIFEIRAGFPLFDSFLGSDLYVLRKTVEVLGRLPDPWWGAFEERALWFEENGEPKSEADQKRAGVLHLRASKSSIRDKLRSIGVRDDPPESGDDGPMMEKAGVRLEEEEIESPGDLLEKMLQYRPEERIRMEDVVRHPWFES